MEDQPANYHAEFLRSPHHAWLGLLTLGLGLLSAQVLGLIVGATAYVLGWIYLPDMPFFKGWVNRRRDAAKRSAMMAQVADIVKRRDTMLAGLGPSGRERYSALAEVCRHIESASADGSMASIDAANDPRLRKLDELMWTYLRLLSLEESLKRFLDTERREDVPALVSEAEQVTAKLAAEVEALKAKGGPPAAEGAQRLLDSRLELLEVLRRRRQRVDQAQSNLALVVAEQERLDQQIKLIRADALAIRNAETLTARIDATVEHLDQTNQWLSELDEFKQLEGDLPPTEVRVGYNPSAPLTTPGQVPMPPRIPEAQPGNVRRPPRGNVRYN
jgi:hypothetical protein